MSDAPRPLAPGPSPEALAREEEVLARLRDRLKSARDRRGACPSWEELKADLLPGGKSREGRDARLAHRAECPYCDAHVREWEKSLDHTSDALAAVEKGIARGIFQGAKKLAGRVGGKKSREESGETSPSEPQWAAPHAPVPTYEPTPLFEPRERPFEAPTLAPSFDAPAQRIEAPAPHFEPPAPARVEPPRAEPARVEPPRMPPPAPIAPPATEVSPTSTPTPAPPAPVAPPQDREVRRYEPPPPRPAPPQRPEPETLTRMLVVQVPPSVNPPPSVYLCADVLEAAVVMITELEELEGDPDLKDVCGLVMVSHLDPGEWPKLLRRARSIVPRRPVVIMSLFGQELSAGARRALGSSLLAASDPPERLLLALDPDLR